MEEETRQRGASPEAGLETLSFEEALSQLEAIVDQLERGDVSLDKAIDAYSRGMALKPIVRHVWKKPG